RDGAVPEALVDRAASRVLRQKVELGLLDPDWSPVPAAVAAVEQTQAPADGHGIDLDLDPPAGRALARDIAEESVVLLANDGTLPLAPGARVALIGPQADDFAAMLGCYTFPSHVGSQHPDVALGVEIPTLLSALRAEIGRAPV